MKVWLDNQCSAYDLECCLWSQLPDIEWENAENDFVAGEFVWTGYDYLGELTSYNANWRSRSFYFQIIDLYGLPKDRYYLSKSLEQSKRTTYLGFLSMGEAMVRKPLTRTTYWIATASDGKIRFINLVN